jgi:hypothetical protein
MGNINWVVWLLAAANGVLVGAIICVIGMWMDKRRGERLDAAALADLSDSATNVATAMQALKPLPRRTPGASLNDDSGA